MVTFDETQQKKRLADFRKREAEDVARLVSSQTGMPYVSLTTIPINTDALSLVEEEYAREHELATYALSGRNLKMAARIPDSEGVKAKIKELEDEGYRVQIHIASSTSLEKAWSHYAEIAKFSKTSEGLLNVSSESVAEFISSEHSQEEVKALIKEAIDSHESGISRVLEIVVAGAISLDASDIHIETAEDLRTIRMRIDGVLQPIVQLDETSYRRLLSRIKLLSGLKLNIRDQAQDGRFSIQMGKRSIEIRTSIIPGSFGESVVMRVLDQANIGVGIEELGMQPNLLARVRREINRPNGLILNTGPTGSGKTTTLYSFLQNVSKPGLKTITIEDPVEYHLKSIVQTQVEREHGYDFYDGLKSAMRQDPDIIMVGEIRDENTARTALHAGLTGHLVFSTLHTNDAFGTFPRLVELGADQTMLGEALNVAMAQRLVRRLCDHCKRTEKIEGKDRQIIDKVAKTFYDPDPYSHLLEKQEMHVAGGGCESCGNTGYSGRIGIFEAIIMDDQISALVKESPSDPHIREAAMSQGILTLAQDGLVKVLEGTTDLKELQRVIDIDTTSIDNPTETPSYGTDKK